MRFEKQVKLQRSILVDGLVLKCVKKISAMAQLTILLYSKSENKACDLSTNDCIKLSSSCVATSKDPYPIDSRNNSSSQSSLQTRLPPPNRDRLSAI